MKIVFLSHTDLDGLAWLVPLQYYRPDIITDEDTTFYFLNYGDIERDKVDIDDLLTSDQIFFIDFSPTKELAVAIMQANIETFIMDHHDSAYNTLSDLIIGSCIKDMFDLKTCGSKIFYDWCKSIYDKPIHQGIEKFIYYVNCFDTWDETNPDFEKAIDLDRLFRKHQKYDETGLEKYLPFVSDMYETVTESNDLDFCSDDLAIIYKETEKENKKVKECVRSIRVREDSKGNKFGIILLDCQVSIIAWRVYRHYPEIKYLLIINTKYPDNLSLSVRSSCTNDFDATTLKNIRGHAKSAAMVKTDPVTDKRFLHKLWISKTSCLEYK